MGLLTLLSIHPAAAGPAFVPQNHGLHHPLLPLSQSHPPRAFGLEVTGCTRPEERVSATWPDLASADCLLTTGLREGSGKE